MKASGRSNKRWGVIEVMFVRESQSEDSQAEPSQVKWERKENGDKFLLDWKTIIKSIEVLKVVQSSRSSEVMRVIERTRGWTKDAKESRSKIKVNKIQVTRRQRFSGCLLRSAQQLFTESVCLREKLISKIIWSADQGKRFDFWPFKSDNKKWQNLIAFTTTSSSSSEDNKGHTQMIISGKFYFSLSLSSLSRFLFCFSFD